MSFIRTVLGDIAPSTAGLCYAHEHIIIDPSYATRLFPEFELSNVDRAVQELTELRKRGIGLMVDTMPFDCGRNAAKLAEVSVRSGVSIICPTGLHLEKYYPPGHWGSSLNVNQLADLFVADIEVGVTSGGCRGIDVDSPMRAGVIKVAGGRDRLSSHERRVFAAAARASRRTGCPIITHTEEGTAGLEQASILIDSGVPPEHIILSHTDRLPDIEYHTRLLATGICLEYDSAFRWKSKENHTTRLILNLAPGFPNQLMLGMDAARSSYWRSYGGTPGLTFLVDEYRQHLLNAGLREDLMTRIFVDNPRTAFTFERSEGGHG